MKPKNIFFLNDFYVANRNHAHVFCVNLFLFFLFLKMRLLVLSVKPFVAADQLTKVVLPCGSTVYCYHDNELIIFLDEMRSLKPSGGKLAATPSHVWYSHFRCRSPAWQGLRTDFAETSHDFVCYHCLLEERRKTLVLFVIVTVLTTYSHCSSLYITECYNRFHRYLTKIRKRPRKGGYPSLGGI